MLYKTEILFILEMFYSLSQIVLIKEINLFLDFLIKESLSNVVLICCFYLFIYLLLFFSCFLLWLYSSFVI